MVKTLIQNIPGKAQTLALALIHTLADRKLGTKISAFGGNLGDFRSAKSLRDAIHIFAKSMCT